MLTAEQLAAWAAEVCEGMAPMTPAACAEVGLIWNEIDRRRQAEEQAEAA